MVSYEYVAFNPTEFESEVEVLEEDIEQYYIDNERNFEVPKQLKVRHIQFKVSEGATKEDLVEQATEAFEKAQAGQDFASLVAEYSQDEATKEKSGDLGWLTQGRQHPVFDAEVFKLEPGTVSDLIETPQGYQIALVDEVKQERTKELEEVRANIEKAIRKEQAEVYMIAEIEELYEQWDTSGSDLATFLPTVERTKEKKIEKTTEALAAGKEVGTQFGLTAKILQESGEKLSVELRNNTILVQVSERIEADIPTLQTVKEAVIEKYRIEKSKDLAREVQQTLAQGLETEGASLEQVAANETLIVEKATEVSLTKPGTGILANRALLQKLLLGEKESYEPIQHEAGGKQYVVQVTSVTSPKQELIDEKFEQAKSREQNAAGRVVMQSILNQLKANSEIETNSGLIGSVAG